MAAPARQDRPRFTRAGTTSPPTSRRSPPASTAACMTWSFCKGALSAMRNTSTNEDRLGQRRRATRSSWEASTAVRYESPAQHAATAGSPGRSSDGECRGVPPPPARRCQLPATGHRRCSFGRDGPIIGRSGTGRVAQSPRRPRGASRPRPGRRSRRTSPSAVPSPDRPAQAEHHPAIPPLSAVAVTRLKRTSDTRPAGQRPASHH